MNAKKPHIIPQNAGLSETQTRGQDHQKRKNSLPKHNALLILGSYHKNFPGSNAMYLPGIKIRLRASINCALKRGKLLNQITYTLYHTIIQGKRANNVISHQQFLQV
jgi:hypothetical protein